MLCPRGFSVNSQPRGLQSTGPHGTGEGRPLPLFIVTLFQDEMEGVAKTPPGYGRLCGRLVIDSKVTWNEPLFLRKVRIVQVAKRQVKPSRNHAVFAGSPALKPIPILLKSDRYVTVYVTPRTLARPQALAIFGWCATKKPAGSNTP